MAQSPADPPGGQKMPRWIEYLDAETLEPAKRNPKRHAPEAIGASMERFRYSRALVLDERTRRLVHGHGQRETLLELKRGGKEAPEGILVDGSRWLVPVERGWASRDDAEAAAAAVAHNRATELGGWNDEDLGETLRELAAEDDALLAAAGYEEADLAELVGGSVGGGGIHGDGGGAGGGGAGLGGAGGEDAELDAVPDEPRRVWVKYGQLYALGRHRVLCGDSLTPELGRALAGLQVAEVVEDPPYAIYGSSTGVASEIADWEMVLPFFEAVLRRARELLPMFGHSYVFCDWRSFAPWVIAAKRAEMALRNKLVWDKGGSGLGSNWANTYEEVAYFSKLPQQATMRGTSEQRGVRTVHRPNLLRHPRPTGEEREHNAAKPVALLRELVTAGSDEGQVVLDMFCGSGSTMVACEAEGRICVTADKEPKWVQVAIERWQRVTGRKAELVEDAA